MNSSSLKTKTSKLLVIGVAVLAFLGALLGLSLQNNSSKVHADNTTPSSTVDITVHKLQYTGTAPSIDNDGSELSLPSTVSAYDPSKYGDVGFTVYDITSGVSSKYSTDGLTNGDISEIVENASTYETDANKVANQKDVGTDGTVTFSDLPNYSSSQNHHVYLIAETKSSKLIKTTAQPMVVVTPMTNSTGDGYLSTVNVYPKNEIQTLSFILTKQAEKNGQSAAALAGAKFLLYKGTPGSGTQVTNSDGSEVELTTDDNGKITATNLTVGSYYFVEEASDDVSTDGSAGDGYLLGKDALNDANNKLTFTIDSDGNVTPTDQTYINYQKPASTKTVTNGSSTDNSFDQGATVKYQATITVPNNISDYTKFNWVDTPGTGLKYSSDTAFTLTYGDSVDGTQTALTNSTDYNLTYDTDNKTYKIDFLDSSNQLLNSSLAGKVVTISYSMALDPTTAKVATDIDNNYNLNWNNGTGKNTNTGKATVYTYGAQFIKKSAGILGTGTVNSALSGAEFVVRNSNGEYLNQISDGWVSSQDDATVFTSGTDGTFSVEGLAKGAYSLKEIKAPTGYQLRTSDLSFTVDESSNSKTIEVDDNAKGLLSTGSQWLMLIIALVIVIGTTLGVKEYRKARKVNA
ncbi:pilin N-terminal domain-containing protein [Latilactobacillus curvatus]|uniref:pilin N-terminal domain-containing protein n=1 Tax=Latilactobacillus curvatus TaxID=28038 RepID=UPI0010ADC52D|nr:pilin N-terminal domain-containing protein [Latilactobacillus curvatus]MCP8867380.1 isopeptide-forming domain-containing fimbrial protein [Latilactobacillus curvatus]MCP8870920.1 isopeptide-forming domain-containing fimbrial protein [Latilactobacillus curvatus]TJY20889.1 isopeptide-forming domain-containing fimbrial protein [Latilactobacillus curvatus]